MEAKAPVWMEELKRRFGPHVMTGEYERHLYRYDASGCRRGVPLAVVHVRTAEEAAWLFDLARREGLRVVPRGSGTGLSGGAVPVEGSLVVTCERLREVRRLDRTWRRVVAEAGVINGQLDALVRPAGLFYPPDPASYRVSTIGGNIAENSGGPHAVKYGITGQRVLALEVVDAEGRQGWLYSGTLQDGPDLVSLIVGSEGTLALVLAAELLLEPLPEAVVTLLVSFPSIGAATDFVSDVIAKGLDPSTLEFMDRNTIVAVEEWGVARYPSGAEAVLLLELDGYAGEVEAAAEEATELAQRHGALEVLQAKDEEEREALWLGRRGAFAATTRHSRRLLTQDITVPRERLTEMLREVERIAEKYGLLVATVGHAGDGNLHPDFPYDPDNEEEARRVHAANDEVMEVCVRLGGSITGEHGIGIDKLHQLPIMYGPTELGLMWAVKEALDPGALLNPGKAIPEAARCIPQFLGRAHEEPRSGAELQEAVLLARAEGRPLRLSLCRFTEVDPDLPNLTMRVGAGCPLALAEAALADTPFTLPIRPLFAETFAEAVLTNDFGPEHWSRGTMKGYLLAAAYVTGAGELVEFGRGVVKNVAGYDLVRLLLGSQGRLAVPFRFTVRLEPRRPLTWYGRPWHWEDGLPSEAAQMEALVAWPTGEGYHLFGATRREPGGGWEPLPDLPERLAARCRALRAEGRRLDLTLAPEQLSAFLGASGRRPELLLPAAARCIFRVEREEAEALVQLASAVAGSVRAGYGPRNDRLAPRTELRQAWEERLERVFDPDGILREWFPESEGLP